jgi:signal peptidase I
MFLRGGRRLYTCDPMADRGILGDIAFAVVIFIAIAGALYLYSGGWPPMVSITSTSMVPHMDKGDLVIIQGLSRGDVKTYEGPESLDYLMFEERGDVIVYRPDGQNNVTPVIHRAIRWVNESEPMWHNGPAAPWSGYITLGDNNQGIYDQLAGISGPVKKEWIIGIARYRIPYVGYIRSVIP